MICANCKRANARIEAFLRIGGKRLYLPIPGGCVIATVLGFTASGELRVQSDSGEQHEISACSVAHTAIPGVA